MKISLVGIEINIHDESSCLNLNSFYSPFISQEKKSKRTLTLTYNLIEKLPPLGKKSRLEFDALYWKLWVIDKIKVFDIYTGRKVKENIYRLYLKKNLEDIDIIIPENILTFQERYPSYFKGIDIPDPFIPFLGNILLSEILPHFGGFLIHAACVEYRDGHACIFVGPSRAGKTTLAKLWQNRGFEILGDDIVGIRRGEEGNFYAYPVPWGDSLSNRRMNRRVKLNKIFFISKSKDKRNKIEFISQKEAMNEMIRGSLLPYWDRKLTIIELQLIHQILDIIPSFRLVFYPDDSLLNLLKGFE